MAEGKIKIRLVKSTIGVPLKIKKVVFALGLSRPNSVVVHPASPSILGMVAKTKHMIEVTQI